MNMMDKRIMIYTALALLCSTASVFLGLAAGFWSFIQIAAVIEALYWVELAHSTKHEQIQSVK